MEKMRLVGVGVAPSTEVSEVGVSIGRSSSCDLSFKNDVQLSRFHCFVYPGPEGWMVRDLGSCNGTWVNEKRIKKVAPLKDGDKIRAGRVEYVVEEIIPRTEFNPPPLPRVRIDVGRERTVADDELVGRISAMLGGLNAKELAELGLSEELLRHGVSLQLIIEMPEE